MSYKRIYMSFNIKRHIHAPVIFRCTWVHIKYPSSLFVCTRVYKHTHTHTTVTPAKIEKYTRQTPLFLPLPKHSLPRQQQALTMNKLKQTPLPIPPRTRMQVLSNTCDSRAYQQQRDWTVQNKQNAPTRVYMYTHTRAYINVYAYTYTDIHIYIYIHIHMHYTHIHAHT